MGRLAGFSYRQIVKRLKELGLLSSLEEAAWACHRVPADAPWTALEAWPRGTSLRLEGLGLSLGWDEVYAGVGLRP